MKTLALAAILSFAALPAALAQSSHGMDHSSMHMEPKQMEGAVHAKAVINSIGDGTVNVSHDPIPEIGWPAMTMDMPLLADARMMGDVKEGDSVTIMLMKGDDGMYAIGAIMPN
ncbi:copper-binding protein [Roseibium aestuarii]|uniref:Copper-binding protein n=1 Tax=Roseibium aestuarii TaxID=2600299 RepID=A0ABW4K2Y5_9HYPH|nr:copper-binding protein [Roseibium aestuarii]